MLLTLLQDTLPTSAPIQVVTLPEPIAAPVSGVDLATWGGIATLVSLLISLIKIRYPEQMEKHARLVAMGLGLVIAVVSKSMNIGFHEVTWPLLIIAGISAGPASGVIYKHGTKDLAGPPPEEKNQHK